MSKSSKLAIALLGALWIGVIGCRTKEPATKPESKTSDGPVLAPPQQKSSPATQDGRASLPTEGALNGKEPAEVTTIKKNLKLLPASDRALAEEQKICPVSGEALGAMGPPKKVKVAGREVFICCPSCEEPLEKEPAKYLAKVGLRPSSTQ
jgi:hypothetical protein